MRGREFAFVGFAGGLNTRSGPLELASDELTATSNFVAGDRGSLVKRRGDVLLRNLGLGAGVAVHTIEAIYGVGGPGVMLATSDGRVIAVGADGASQIEIATGVGAAPWEFVDALSGTGMIVGNYVYGVNGTLARHVSSGTPWTGWTAATGTLPIGKYLLSAGNRMWMAGMSAYLGLADPGSALAFSDIGDTRGWPAANVVLFDPGDGEALTGISTLGPYLLVFKPSKSWVIYDLDTGANRPLAKNVGCVSHRSIVETPQGAFFLSRDQGVMRTDGSGAVPISDAVLPTLLGFTAAAGVAAAAAVVYLQDRLYLLLDGALFDYDTRLKSWWRHTTLDANDLVAVRFDQVTPSRLYAAADASRVMWMMGDAAGHTDGIGGALPASARSRFLDVGPAAARKRIRHIALEGSGVLGANAFLSYDTVTPDGLLAEAAMATAPEVAGRRELHNVGVGDGVAVEVFSTQAQPAQLDRFTVYADARRD